MKTKTKHAKKSNGRSQNSPSKREDRGLNSDKQSRITNIASEDEDDRNHRLPSGNDVEDEEDREKLRKQEKIREDEES